SSKGWTRRSWRPCGSGAGPARCRTCPPATPGCSSSWTPPTTTPLRPHSTAGPRRCWRTSHRPDGCWRAPRSPAPSRAATRGGGAGAGLTAGPGGDRPGPMAFPGWEDAAVAPDRLAGYLREFRALLARHGFDGALFGHFGAGCVHVRIDFDPATPAGATAMR